MTTLSDLIARLEAAKEGSRELDAEIAEFIGLDGRRDVSNESMRRLGMSAHDVIAKRYTTSLDAALTLVPDGYCLQINRDKHNYSTVIVAKPNRKIAFPIKSRWHSVGATTPLALCIAAMKAREVGR